MTVADWAQVALYLGTLLAVARPLGRYMARVYAGEPTVAARLLGPVERLAYRLAGVSARDEMTWPRYVVAMLLFSTCGLLLVYALQRLQGLLPLNPQHLGPVPPDLAFNTAASFVSNTNWQAYGGETTLSYLTQMLGLTVQNFVSAATGMAVLVALIRGLAQHSIATLGSFWVDLTRSVLYILLPLSLVLALALASQGAVQTLRPSVTVQGPQERQAIALGPAASQVAIKQLGTNGGGFFGANSAHPFENPTPLSNYLELLAILLIPVALCFTYGEMVGDVRQGWAILAAMTVLFLGMVTLATWSEHRPSPALSALDVDASATPLQPGGNMEGKETRFGPTSSALWAMATTAASNGSVNCMHDSLMPLGGLAAMWLMQLGEVVYGGVGSGLYGMLAFVLVAVFVAGLMVGRTPEYLGKKVETHEMKMAALVILVPVVLVLAGTALAVSSPSGVAAILNPGPHGFSEVLYAFSSAGNNNGSAFAGLSANGLFYNVVLGLATLVARFGLAVPILAMAGALAAKRRLPGSAGTLPTHTPLFMLWLVAVVVIVGALSFLPVLALGPIAEQLMLAR